MDIFRETTFRPLGGAAPSNFLHALEIDPGYLAHTPKGPAPKFKLQRFKICPKIQRVGLNNFGASGSIPTKLFPVDMLRGRGDNVGTISGRPDPKIWEGEKTSTIRGDF